jgi:hypothetical protein
MGWMGPSWSDTAFLGLGLYLDNLVLVGWSGPGTEQRLLTLIQRMGPTTADSVRLGIALESLGSYSPSG